VAILRGVDENQTALKMKRRRRGVRAKVEVTEGASSMKRLV